jgi:Repeat of unknown function (DUF5648)
MTRQTTRALALCLSAILAACGGGQDPASSTATERTATAEATEETTPPASRASTTPPVSAATSQAWAESASLNRAEVQQERVVGDANPSTVRISPKAITAPSAPLYRFYNIQTGAHLFTRDLTERDRTLNTLPQFRYEGAVFSAWSGTDTGLSPVYRFYNTLTGAHFFTISETEKNQIQASRPEMNLDGVAYYAAKTALAGTTALFRFYHRQKGFHFYTTSTSERDSIVANLSATYNYEGVGYYVNSTVGSYDKALASLAGKVNAYGNNNAQGENARFGNLRGMGFDPSGNLYVVDREGDGDWYNVAEIRRISAAGLVTSFAGNWNTQYSYRNGVGSGIDFGGIGSLTFDAAGTLYFGDVRTVRSINTSATSTTIAGSLTENGYTDGQSQAARLLGVTGIVRDSLGNIFVSECFTAASYPSSRIRKISPTGVVSTLAGPADAPYYSSSIGFADGQGTSARFNCLGQMGIDSNDNLYVADQRNHRIRKITPAGLVSTFAGQATAGVQDGDGTAARFHNPYALAVDKATGNVYTADWSGYTVRKITPSGTVTTIVGTPYTRGVFFGSLPAGLAEVGGLAVRNGRLYIASLNGIYWTNL